MTTSPAAKYVPLLVVALVAGGLGFFGGKTYAAKSRGSDVRGPGMGMLRQGGPGGTGEGGVRLRGGSGAAGGFVAGEVLSKDEHGITVKLMDGGSKIILTSASTTVSKPTDVALTDLAVGESVVVTGKANDDGSLTAESITVRGEGAMPMFGGRGVAPAPSDAPKP